ncbi:hypothetical protein [Microtetraspora sp. NBRC 16547]|uniref:hypothetical protein n=1 Tax=Microtetraspora sp. NBRC 16547 TaxID=3030993 RepID=UPI0024A2950A|nr:hypothetical protein [Microtetraspora sp. NBRC 16547]GLX02355.1 hypothetical protein Misp02_64410 [Microtetraspora sp. NBRC 16547]
MVDVIVVRSVACAMPGGTCFCISMGREPAGLRDRGDRRRTSSGAAPPEGGDFDLDTPFTPPVRAAIRETAEAVRQQLG